ncbi:unnamed protein product [Anisakis simplex]|uniref:Uncharacterized protein n=1 Tax=Anisakis simplex TaxID=6269 RepID=A0A0M3IZ66_ANISI|nr:unnamed protein product [Anisakis simplex]
MELVTATLWWSGPAWLSQDKPFWPKSAYCDTQDIDDDDKHEQFPNSASFTAQVLITPPPINFIDTQRFNNWSKLRRTTAYILRFIKKLAPAQASWLSNVSSSNTSFTANDLALAETVLLRQTQSCIDKTDIEKWELHLDKQQIWRCGGRLPSNLGFLPRKRLEIDY